jgi:TetR/AcrR family transcriptional repressor of mexJK operon
MPGAANKKTAKRAGGAKRAAVLEAARRVFLEAGYAAASMDSIAEAAQVSKATLYAHFKSKEALFGAMIQSRCDDAQSSPVPQDVAKLAPREGLERIALRFLELLLSPDALSVFRVVMAEAPRQPELGRAFYEAGPARTIMAVSAYLDHIKSRHNIRIGDSQVAAELFLGLVRGPLHLRALLDLGAKPSAAEQKRHAKAAAEMFLAAYEPR